jgi:SAM-dependent methyltransferase
MTNDLTQIKMFENKNYWELNRYTGLETDRIIYTTSWIPKDITSLLDAGCGNGILVNNLRTPHFVVGTDRSFSALMHVQINPCQADILNLPFADQSFDIVVGTEIIEHLPIKDFNLGLSEIGRLSRKYILITVPYQENLSYAKVECPICKCNFHPDFHRQSFNRNKMASMFSDIGLPCKLLKVEGIFPVWNLLGVGLLRNWLGKPKTFPSFTICPQCGYFNMQISHKEDQIYNRINKTIRATVKAVWPLRKKGFRWLIALYTKENT